MAVSWHEVAAIAVGLGGGYWLVSRIIEGKGDEPQDSRQGAPDPAPASSSSPPWWEVLGVPQIATRDEVARAYKRRISEYHPDKVAQMGEEIRALAERRSKEIITAYDEAMRRI
jgi:DnaJ-domain-containing protein 1